MKLAVIGLAAAVILAVLFAMVPADKVDSLVLVPTNEARWLDPLDPAQHTYKSGLRMAVEGRLHWLGLSSP